MAGRKWLSPSKRALIRGYRLYGLTLEQVAQRMGVHKATVSRSLKHSLERGHDRNKPPTGQKKTISDRQKRLVLRAIFENPFAPWPDVVKRLEGISLSTLKRIASAEGIRRNVALRKPMLSPKNIADRREWADKYVQQDWRKVIFTDECSIVIGKQNSWPRVSTRKGGQEKARNYSFRVNNGRQSIMVWAGIAYNFKTPLVLIELAPSRSDGIRCTPAETFNGEKYAEQIFQGPLYTATQLLPGHKVLEDNTPPHKAAICQQIRTDFGIESIKHPGNSPDLNPIENIWSMLKNRIDKRSRLPSNASEFFKVAQEVWDKEISLEAINACIDSMKKRQQIVKAQKGGSTKY